MRHFTAGLITLALLLGCARPGPGPGPEEPPPGPEPGLALAVEPQSGPPGTMLTLQVQPGVGLPLSGPEGKSWAAHVCWGECRPDQWQLIHMEQGPDGRYTGRMRAPAFTGGRAIPNGPQPLTIACQTKGCEGVPSFQGSFRLTDALPARRWADLPAVEATPLPRLDGNPWEAIDPANPDRLVKCQGGTVQANDPGRPPELQITEDGGKSWWFISLRGVRLGQQAGMAGCRAVALDPNSRETFYLAGAGHRAAPEEGRYPPPLFTTDAGRTWQPVPAPAGYDQPRAFLGYTIAAKGVTAWFAATPAGKEQATSFAGLFTGDSGQTWREIPLACPEAGPNGPCAWEAPASLFLPGYRGLLFSPDQGRTWEWASYNGPVLQALARGFSRVGGQAVEVAGACLYEERQEGCIPLLRSEDGGRSWIWVELPDPPPTGWSKEPDLRIQPDGSLLFRSDTTEEWYQLRREESVWEHTKAPK